MATKQKYVYSGAVLSFNNVVATNWTGETWAVSEKQAASNLAYQYKRRVGLLAASKVSLAKMPVRI